MNSRQDELNDNSKLSELRYKREWLRNGDDTTLYTNTGIAYNEEQEEWFVLYHQDNSKLILSAEPLPKTIRFDEWHSTFTRVTRHEFLCTDEASKLINNIDGVYTPSWVKF